MPPKPGVHPRADTFIHAMPAYLADRDAVSVKWVAGYPQNPSRGLPYINGLMVINDAETGVPQAITDAAEITAARTAAASGACLRAHGPEGWRDVALLGFGEQGHYHAKVVEALNPQARLHIYDPRVPVGSRPEAGVDLDVRVYSDARAAVRDAQIVVTTGPIVKNPTPALGSEWLAGPSLLLPVDFDFYVRPEFVGAADLFIVDDIDQFEYYRTQGHFKGWPDARTTTGRAFDDELRGKLTVACNLGVGALDTAFADAVLRAAQQQGTGQRLPW